MENLIYNYGFKINNYSAEDEIKLTFWLRHNCKYYIFAHTIGNLAIPKIEGYLSLKRRMMNVALKDKLTMARIHITELNGEANLFERYNYITRIDPKKYVEHGNISIVNDMDMTEKIEVAEKLKHGFSVASIIADYPHVYLEYGANIERMRTVFDLQKQAIVLDDEIKKEELENNEPPRS